MNTMIKSKILSILNDIEDFDEEVETLPNLITDGHLDSFATLLLISNLEKMFSVDLQFDEHLLPQLESVSQIEVLIQAHLQ